MIGLDTGRIIIYKTGIENYYSNYTEVINIKPHSNRIMGLDDDIEKNVIYSCGSDNKFIMSYLNSSNQYIVIDNTISVFTNLKFYKKNKRIFLTNILGQLFIYLTEKKIPVYVKKLNAHSKNTIRGLNVQLKRAYNFYSNNKRQYISF